MILRAAAVTGGPEFFASWLQASTSTAPPAPDRWSHYQPKFFPPEEFEILDAFTAILIPSDETPGAREAHVAPFIDFVVNAAAEYAPEMQDRWRTAMRWLRARRFGQLSAEERVSLVEQMAAPERGGSKAQQSFVVYRLLKEMTIHAFYTSRVGLVDVLEYKGLAYLTEFPGCNHAEHHRV